VGVRFDKKSLIIFYSSSRPNVDDKRAKSIGVGFASIKKACNYSIVHIAQMSMIKEPKVSEWASLRYERFDKKSLCLFFVHIAQMSMIRELKASEWGSLR